MTHVEHETPKWNSPLVPLDWFIPSVLNEGIVSPSIQLWKPLAHYLFPSLLFIHWSQDPVSSALTYLLTLLLSDSVEHIILTTIVCSQTNGKGITSCSYAFLLFFMATLASLQDPNWSYLFLDCHSFQLLLEFSPHILCSNSQHHKSFALTPYRLCKRVTFLP